MNRLPEAARWVLEGQLVDASNIVLRLLDAEDSAGTGETSAAARAVYKPVRGERPLADFPASTLAHREVAAWLVADAAGWEFVPHTRWYDGELGPGSLQLWVGPLEPVEQTRVALLEEEEYLEQGDRWRAIAAFDGEDGPLLLTHDDGADLRAIAAFDVITNNADRKGSHLIETPDGLRAIDNGLSFHVDDKLRTVLWGCAGEELTDDERAALVRLTDARHTLSAALEPHLAPEEIAALHRRTDALLEAGRLPEPPAERYALPWPPL